MTRFVAKEIDAEGNAPKFSLWKEFGELLLKLGLAVILIYVLLGLAVDWIVPHISFETEMKLAKAFQSKDPAETSTEEQAIKQLLDRLLAGRPELAAIDFKVRIIEDADVVNALAYPGGQIVLYRGLLKEIKSENELAMVLGHEMGHYANRDHLRGLGRGLIFMLLTSFFGADQQLSRIFGNSLGAAEMKFSQEQEKRADAFGLEVLQQTYGHVAGATDFFEEIKAKEKLPRFLYILASHPHPDKRILAIKHLIQTHGWVEGVKVAWKIQEENSGDTILK